MENNNSLFEHFSFQVDKGQAPLRIDKYLMNFVENASDLVRANMVPGT